ncbi:MAG TPA: tRNA threonylcarbamoyladenosine dehydratase [Leucothrix mucor]|nr:tRNA threonylcarbamoyladenosine dehydratase [Leucothrix mucor]
MNIHERTGLLIGEENLYFLQHKHVLIAGVGGVGSFVAEAIVRAGVGKVTLVDHDEVSHSNINRQLIALHSTIGKAKVEVMKQRALDINPDVQITTIQDFIKSENIEEILTAGSFDYVLDCIDSISSKVALVVACQEHQVPIISSMGAGGRIDASKIQVARLDKTIVCPLARMMRQRMRKAGGSLKYPVIFSDEIPRKGTEHRPIEEDENAHPRSVNGTISYLPSLFGLHMAGYVLQHFIKGL